jgi:hypothetical protein
MRDIYAVNFSDILCCHLSQQPDQLIMTNDMNLHLVGAGM